jgi:hypothetical protein
LLVRDLLLPVLWISALLGDDFVWRGNQMTSGGRRDPRTIAAEPANRPAGQVSGPY